MDAVNESVGWESAERHRVWRADAGASQHRNGQLRRHAHVNCNAITLLHPERLQDIGKLLHFTMKLLISKGTNLARLTLPDQRRFILAPGLKVAIKAVVGEIDLAAGEPLGPRAIPLKNSVPLFEPMQFLGNTSPELFRLLYGLAVNALVLFQTFDMRLLAEVFGAFKLPPLLQNGIDVCRCLGSGGLIRHSLFLAGLELVRNGFARRFYCDKAGMSASPRMGIERSASERTLRVRQL